MGLFSAVYIWTFILFPTHWPIIVAGIAVLIFGRNLKNRGKFFIVSLFICYGMRSMVHIPSPFIWFFLYDRQYPPQEIAVFYYHALDAISILLSLWTMRYVAVHYWHRLYPFTQRDEKVSED